MVVPDVEESLENTDSKRAQSQKITLKILIPANVAGSIIGKGGEAIKDLKSRTNAQIKVSGRDELFPYTDERIVLLVAPAENAMEAVTFIHSKLRSTASEDSGHKQEGKRNVPKRHKEMKLVIADTSAGKVIGKKGETVKKIQEDHKVKVFLTSKDDWGVVPGERVATISGKEDHVNGAIEDILAIVLEDSEARLNRSLAYPPYPMFDNFAYHGPPPGMFQGRGPLPRRNNGPPPKNMNKTAGFDINPRYNGYQAQGAFQPRQGYNPRY